MAARDYKPTPPRKPKPPAPLGSWVSFVTGLGLGLVVALAVYFWNARPSAPPASAPPAAEVAPPEVEAPRMADAPPGETESAEAAEPADLEPPRPKFDFYKILPEMEVPVQDWEKDDEAADKAGKPDNVADKEAKDAKPGTDPAAKPDKAAAAPERGAYVLQIGSYKAFEEADQAKARLAMQGITANIQRVVINGQDVWFRVHVGPLSDPNQMRAMRLKLQQSNTEFIVLKIGGPGTT